MLLVRFWQSMLPLPHEGVMCNQPFFSDGKAEAWMELLRNLLRGP